MKERVKKLRRITSYFQQRKMISVGELQKASMHRGNEERALESLYMRKSDYLNETGGSMQGPVDIAVLMRFHGAREFIENMIDQQKHSVLDSIREENARREDVRHDSIKHKIWEKVVENGETDFRKHLETLQNKVADDLALVHEHRKRKNPSAGRKN